MNEVAGREQQIAEIEATLKISSIPESVRKLLEKQLQDLRADRDYSSIQGIVDVSDDGRINGVAVGVNLGRIIFGRDPEEDERRRLVWYLTRLASKLYRLPLRGLDEQLEQNKGIGLPQVYSMLATTSTLASRERAEKVRRYFEQPGGKLKSEYDLNGSLPSETIVGLAIWDVSNEKIDHHLTSDELHAFLNKQKMQVEKHQQLRVLRPKSLIQAVQNHRRLLLLGDPGSGKSTFLRHLAWVLAQQGLDQLGDTTKLRGWDDEHLRLPIILPLRTLAGKLAQQGEGDTDSVVTKALRDELQRYNIGQVDDLLSESLHRGTILLLCDGLDEVPVRALPDVADRSQVLDALDDFTSLYNKLHRTWWTKGRHEKYHQGRELECL